MLCYKCGSKAVADADFCHKCGAKLVVDGSEPRTAGVDVSAVSDPGHPNAQDGPSSESSRADADPHVPEQVLHLPIEAIDGMIICPLCNAKQKADRKLCILCELVFNEGHDPTAEANESSVSAISSQPNAPPHHIELVFPASWSSVKTITEVHDLLKANVSHCPRVKKVSLKRHAVALRARRSTTYINTKYGDYSISAFHNMASVSWIVSYVIFIAAVLALNYFAWKFSWPLLVPWAVWACIFAINAVVRWLLSRQERKEVATYISETLGIKH